MKGGIQGLKVSKVSLTLIGLVYATVIALAWTKTSFLTSFIPTQSGVLQLGLGSREKSKGDNNSVQTGTKQIESLGSSGMEATVERGYTENMTVTNKGEITPGVLERAGSDELSGGKNKSEQAEIVHESSSTVKSSVEREQDQTEQTRNLSATTRKKDIPLAAEGSGVLFPGKNKSKHAEIVPDNSSIPSGKGEQIRNFSAMTGKKDCNYAKGKWVYIDNWPLYSGSGCKQWLSPMWACRLTQRTDFKYEKLRWQPKGCKMEAFTGPKFLRRWGRTTICSQCGV